MPIRAPPNIATKAIIQIYKEELAIIGHHTNKKDATRGVALPFSSGVRSRKNAVFRGLDGGARERKDRPMRTLLALLSVLILDLAICGPAVAQSVDDDTVKPAAKPRFQ